MKFEVGKGILALDSTLEVRETVFTKEQGIDPSLLTDENDKEAFHGIIRDFNRVVGCGRLFKDESGSWHIGRVAVIKECRGKNLGYEIVEGLIKHCWKVGGESITIHSQHQVVEFYEKLGFVGVGDYFYEAGIKHLEMIVKKK